MKALLPLLIFLLLLTITADAQSRRRRRRNKPVVEPTSLPFSVNLDIHWQGLEAGANMRSGVFRASIRGTLQNTSRKPHLFEPKPGSSSASVTYSDRAVDRDDGKVKSTESGQGSAPVESAIDPNDYFSQGFMSMTVMTGDDARAYAIQFADVKDPAQIMKLMSDPANKDVYLFSVTVPVRTKLKYFNPDRVFDKAQTISLMMLGARYQPGTLRGGGKWSAKKMAPIMSFMDFPKKRRKPEESDGAVACHVSWTLGEVPLEPKLELDPVERSWMPDPKKARTVRTELRWAGGDPDEIVLTLHDISREKGVCLNDNTSDAGVKPDLKFADEMSGSGWKITKLGADAFQATKKDVRGDSEGVTVEALDYGAFGRLKAKALVSGIWIDAKQIGSGQPSITIPRDDNGNHIADVWEEQHGYSGKPPEWDKDPLPKGQKTSGDAITFFEEYRGFYVLQGGAKEHQRLDPRVKEMFYVDDKTFLDQGAWKVSSGIIPLRVHKTMLQGPGFATADRVADFNQGYGGAGHKYAFHIVEMRGVKDKEATTKKDSLGQAFFSGDSATPKACLYIRIWPDRIERFIRTVLYRDLALALTKPESKSAKAFTKAGLPRYLIQDALDAYGSIGNINRVIQDLTNKSVIHEVGHACGVEHHAGTPGRGAAGGDPDCPTRYVEHPEWIKMVILEMLFPQKQIMSLHGTTFCKLQDNCWGQMNVKDP